MVAPCTARKNILHKSWKVKKNPSKYHISINSLTEKKTVFPSPKISTQELLGTKQEFFSKQYISFLHLLFDSKKDHISHHRKI